MMFFFYPDTKGLPLEEVAKIFGDADEVADYAAALGNLGNGHGEPNEETIEKVEIERLE